MISVIIPILFLVFVCMVKKIPLIGGNMIVAFAGAGILAALMGGVTNPINLLEPWYKSFNSISFIFFIILIGSLFSALQMESGAMETVLNILRAIFGKTPQGLVLAIMIALYFGGSVMGTVAAVGAVVGLLIVPALDDLNLDPDLICAIIVTGASMGGMMPPVSNAVILAAGLFETAPDQAIMISYITVGIGLILIALFFCKIYIGHKYRIPESLIPKRSAVAIFMEQKRKLIPLAVLIVLILLNSVPQIKFDFGKWLFSLIPAGDENLYVVISGIPILGKLLHNIVFSMTIAMFVCIVMEAKNMKKIMPTMIKQLKQIIVPEAILIVTAFFLASFSAGGQNGKIAAWAEGLNNPILLIIGGALCLIVAGMITGGQSTSQSMLIPILRPAWTALGLSPLAMTLASSHLAMAGQGCPPADMNTFIIAGLVAGILGKKVNPFRSMMYSLPYCIYLAAVGLIFLIFPIG